jgi:hypothetical protein
LLLVYCVWLLVYCVWLLLLLALLLLWLLLNCPCWRFLLQLEFLFELELLIVEFYTQPTLSVPAHRTAWPPVNTRRWLGWAMLAF